MTYKLKTEMFSQKIEYSGGVFFWTLTPLFSFVSFHLNFVSVAKAQTFGEKTGIGQVVASKIYAARSCKR